MQTATNVALSLEQEDRKLRIELLARAGSGELEELLESLGGRPETARLRGPETGLIMMRGRMGGTGALFNLGEATVTRCTIRLADGVVGHGQRLGGDRKAAELSAIVDALGETKAHATAVRQFLKRIAKRLADEDAKLVQETAATRVDFFTMVRGED